MGRPRKRQREGEQGDASLNDPPCDNGQGDAHTGMPTPAPPQYLPQDPGFDALPVDRFSDLQNGSLNPLQDSDFFAGTNSFDSFTGQDQWPFNAVQIGTFAAQATEPISNDPMGLLSGPHISMSNGGSGDQVATAPEKGCSCLTNLYSTLSSFQSLPPTSFPFSMGALTKATRVAQGACHCEQCPTQYASALQNLMLLSTLLPLIAHEYGKLLAHIDDRASKGGTITFRMGEKEQSLEQMHMHTGAVDCPMAFETDLSTDEWRSMARKAIKRKVVGPDDTSVQGVVDQLESRQRFWHEHPTLIEFQHGTNCKEHGPEVGEEHTCLKLLSRVKGSIEALKLG